MANEKSARLSFKGYDLRVALYRNKDIVKLLAGAVSGYSAYIGATGFQWKAFLIGIAAGAATLAGKLVMDAIDFYFTEVEVEK